MEFAEPRARPRSRVDRREAARMLKSSRDNVRRLDRIGVLKTGRTDRNGTFTYDRREIEELARRRSVRTKPGGEMAAIVFRMFAMHRKFHEIVIETQLDPDTVLDLWRRYQAGFRYADGEQKELDETRAQREHDEQMRAMDEELERRRRGVHFDGEPPPATDPRKRR